MIKQRFLNIKYELLILGYLFIEIFNNIPAPEQINDWCSTPYALTYEFGFNSRFLIGSIIRIFLPYLSVDLLYVVIVISLSVLCFLVSVCLSKTLRTSDEKIKIAVLFLIVLYLSCPASISFLFNISNFGRLDIYLILFSLVSILFINLNKLRYFIPVICFLGMATHQAFIFTYLIIIIGILLFKIYEESKHRSIIILTILTLLTASISFLYFQLFAPQINVSSVNEVINILNKRTDIPISSDMIELEYFLDLNDHITRLVMKDLDLRILNGFLSLIFLYPLLKILFLIWKNTISMTHDKMLKKIICFMALSPIASIPLFLLTIDWGRWFASIIIVQFCFIFFLTYSKCDSMIKSLERLQNYCVKNTHVLIVIISYMSVLGKFGTVKTFTFTNISNMIISVL